MKIVTSFDDDVLKQYESRGSSAFFTIFFEEAGNAYPSASWMDFGGVIVGWWIMATIQLLNGESPQNFYFMDGPFCLKMELASDREKVTCSNDKEAICWTISLVDLVAELKRAANTVIRHLSQMNVDEKGRNSLQSGLTMLAGLK